MTADLAIATQQTGRPAHAGVEQVGGLD